MAASNDQSTCRPIQQTSVIMSTLRGKIKTLNGKALHQYKQTITLNAIQKEAPRATPGHSTGRRLYAQRPTQVTCRIYTKECKGSIYMTFFRSPTLLAHPREYIIFVGGGAAARDRQCIRFQTYSHPEFKFYYDLRASPAFTSIPRRRPEKTGS